MHTSSSLSNRAPSSIETSSIIKQRHWLHRCIALMFLLTLATNCKITIERTEYNNIKEIQKWAIGLFQIPPFDTCWTVPAPNQNTPFNTYSTVPAPIPNIPPLTPVGLCPLPFQIPPFNTCWTVPAPIPIPAQLWRVKPPIFIAAMPVEAVTLWKDQSI